MPAITTTAPGKIILFGEHAVVYGRSAIAVPVESVRARAVVSADIRAPAGRIWLEAPNIGLDADLIKLDADATRLSAPHPLSVAVHSVLEELAVSRPPAFRLNISSTIPIASGMGSGAAVAVASIRAISVFLGSPLSDDRVSALAYRVEQVHHGTPSGIDNTVVTYRQPVFFQRGEVDNRVEFLQPAVPFTIVIGDTGVPSPTSQTVGDVRQAWGQFPDQYEALFDQVGAVAAAAHHAIARGELDGLGAMMDQSHALLQEMGVSSPGLDELVAAARRSGAWGAKLSGGGRGGNMIALVDPQSADQVAAGLLAAGAVRVIVTQVS